MSNRGAAASQSHVLAVPSPVMVCHCPSQRDGCVTDAENSSAPAFALAVTWCRRQTRQSSELSGMGSRWPLPLKPVGKPPSPYLCLLHVQ